MIELPDSFIRRTSGLLGDTFPRFAEALQAEPPVSIRLNPLKGAVLASSAEPVPWARQGYYLGERPAFTFDPLFHAGAYYVQEAASMFLNRVITQYIHEPVRYLDLCAAPGGKSTDAIASLPRGSMVVSNEVVPNRAHILAENIIKWGSPRCFVTRNEASDFGVLSGYFDVIAADVPCSGEGMFRKDPAAIAEWSPANVELCAQRQQAILSDVWEALRPGGLLIYSTCTYNREENEDIVHFLQKQFGATTLPVDIESGWGIASPLLKEMHAYRFMPHMTRSEGLFMAILRKPEEPGGNERRQRLLDSAAGGRKQGKKNKAPALTLPEELRQLIAEADRYAIEATTERAIAIPADLLPDYRLLNAHLDLLHAGITIATFKGKDCIPHTSLALSTALNREAAPRYETDLATALAYLRRESLALPPGTPRGYLLITYSGYPLGWVKNLGNRANNLYPQEWRIRSGHTPANLTAGIVQKADNEFTRDTGDCV